MRSFANGTDSVMTSLSLSLNLIPLFLNWSLSPSKINAFEFFISSPRNDFCFTANFFLWFSSSALDLFICEWDFRNYPKFLILFSLKSIISYLIISLLFYLRITTIIQLYIFNIFGYILVIYACKIDLKLGYHFFIFYYLLAMERNGIFGLLNAIVCV